MNKDPRERENLFWEKRKLNQAFINDLEQAVLAMLYQGQGYKLAKPEKTTISPQLKEQLQSLGYVK